MQQAVFRAAMRGFISVIVGLAFTGLAALIWPPPWTLGQAMIAVGFASFFAAFGSTYDTSRELQEQP